MQGTCLNFLCFTGYKFSILHGIVQFVVQQFQILWTVIWLLKSECNDLLLLINHFNTVLIFFHTIKAGFQMFIPVKDDITWLKRKEWIT
jgi:hypothetical protein